MTQAQLLAVWTSKKAHNILTKKKTHNFIKVFFNMSRMCLFLERIANLI